MVGVYKITNKINGKIYIGQSIKYIGALPGSISRQLNGKRKSIIGYHFIYI